MSWPKGLVEGPCNKTTKKDTGQTIQSVFFFLVNTSPAEGRRRFHKNTAYARLEVWVFGCLGSLTFWKVKRVTREGAKIQYGVKPDILKRGKKNQNSIWCKNRTSFKLPNSLELKGEPTDKRDVFLTTLAPVRSARDGGLWQWRGWHRQGGRQRRLWLAHLRH